MNEQYVREINGYKIKDEEAIRTYENVSSMKSDTKLTEGMYVKTKGYYNINDCGGAEYIIRTKTNDDVEDNGSIHFISNNLVAELILKDGVVYNQFGAKGDGVHDDYTAIYKTHIFANSKNIKVFGCEKSVYYIGDISNSIPVMTDTDFRNANFIIDDENVTTNKSVDIFDIRSEFNSISKTGAISSLNKNQTKISELSGNGKCLCILYNDNKKDFIRKGTNQNEGNPRTDVFRIDNNGEVLDQIIWDFTEVTRINLYPINNKSITIKNGNFITKVNKVDSYNYYKRGIVVQRSNTIIENINHSIEGENETSVSSPYSGFLRTNVCCNVKFNNCSLSSHKIYIDSSTTAEKGSYDIASISSIDIYINNLIQKNDIVDTNFWGIHTSNYVKNLHFNDCVMNRIDAHCGMWNVDINNCLIGYQSIKLIGGGTANITNTSVKSNAYIELREDYGAIFDGIINVKNGKLYIFDRHSNSYKIVQAMNDESWNFGYVCKMPDINIDGFEFHNKDNDNSTCYVIYNSYTNDLPDYTKSYEENAANNVYPYLVSKNVNLKNMTIDNKSARSYILMAKTFLRNYMEDTGSALNLSGMSDLYINDGNRKYNMFVSVDNCEFGTETKVNTEYSTSRNSFFDGSNINIPGEDVSNTHRPVVLFKINNCNYLQLGSASAIVTWEVNNSNIYLLRAGFSNQLFTTFNCKNCTIHYRYSETPSSNNACVWLGGKLSSFDSCKFVMDSNYSLSDISSVEAPFKNLVEDTSKHWLSISGKWIKCSFWSGIETEIVNDEHLQKFIEGYGISITDILDNPNTKVIPRKYGWLSDRPSSVYENNKLPITSIYMPKSSDVIQIWNGTNWVSPTGTIQE